MYKNLSCKKIFNSLFLKMLCEIIYKEVLKTPPFNLININCDLCILNPFLAYYASYSIQTIKSYSSCSL